MIDDAILIKEVPKNEIHIGDIISFDQDGVVVTHRVINIVDENGVTKYQTKGDNNNAPDMEMTTYEKIQGKYQFKINHFGVVINILKSRVISFLKSIFFFRLKSPRIRL